MELITFLRVFLLHYGSTALLWKVCNKYKLLLLCHSFCWGRNPLKTFPRYTQAQLKLFPAADQHTDLLQAARPKSVSQLLYMGTGERCSLLLIENVPCTVSMLYRANKRQFTCLAVCSEPGLERHCCRVCQLCITFCRTTGAGPASNHSWTAIQLTEIQKQQGVHTDKV